jgi:hypothetical protein
MYTTDALVRVDPPDLNELGVSLLDRQSLPPTPSLSNEIAVMQSRSVAEPVIQRFDYDISTTPRSLPILGAIVKEFSVPGVLAEPWLRLGSIAWGGEELKGEIHPLRRDPQGGRRPLFDQICFIQSVPLPLLAPLELRGSPYLEPACSSSRQRLLRHARTIEEALEKPL